MTSTASGQCTALTRSGARCRAWVLSGSAFCWVHDSRVAAERKLARSKGGRARHGRALWSDGSPVVLVTVADVVKVLERALSDLFLLENSIARSRAVGALCAVAVKALEVSELEKRVAALERALEKGGDYDG